MTIVATVSCGDLVSSIIKTTDLERDHPTTRLHPESYSLMLLDAATQKVCWVAAENENHAMLLLAAYINADLSPIEAAAAHEACMKHLVASMSDRDRGSFLP